MLKIFSWNVNGIRAVLKKGALQKFLEEYKPDILCLQEIKAKPEQVEVPEGYNMVVNSADRPGYSGTAILFSSAANRKEINMPVLNNEGRIIVAEFDRFYLVNVYVPNSKPDLSRLKLRENEWDPEFLKFLKELEKTKPVVVCGDFNAAHEEIDLARPKQNHHNAGFTDEERKGIANLLNAGFVDTFRALHPDSKRYTWWSHWGHARENNVGWRIDYFFISKSLKKNLKGAEIYENVTGSDHCPISIDLEV
ncbi:exodeoxyribonuclease III [Candidatus Saccharibacteria bacterium]|nr:exodeoxyribonuclease III [Candidatus Saccharibacteria bacterium]